MQMQKAMGTKRISEPFSFPFDRILASAKFSIKNKRQILTNAKSHYSSFLALAKILCGYAKGISDGVFPSRLNP